MSERITIILEPMPDRPGTIRVPVEQRIRQLLKIAGGGFRLRAVAVRQADQPTNGTR